VFVAITVSLGLWSRSKCFIGEVHLSGSFALFIGACASCQSMITSQMAEKYGE
jgi:hypothetical protein